MEMNPRILSVVTIIMSILLIVSIILVWVYSVRDFGYDADGVLFNSKDISEDQKSNRTMFYVFILIALFLAILMMVLPILTFISIPVVVLTP